MNILETNHLVKWSGQDNHDGLIYTICGRDYSDLDVILAEQYSLKFIHSVEQALFLQFEYNKNHVANSTGIPKDMFCDDCLELIKNDSDHYGYQYQPLCDVWAYGRKVEFPATIYGKEWKMNPRFKVISVKKR
jgi:hypothetical protein